MFAMKPNNELTDENRKVRRLQFDAIRFSKVSISCQYYSTTVRVSVQGVKSLGSHFACLCRGFEVKKNIIIFQK